MSVISASKAERVIPCPASYQLEQQVPVLYTVFSIQGNVYHSAMELLLAGNVTSKDSTDELIGQDLGYGKEWAITQEGVNTKIWPALQAFWEYVKQWDLDDWFIENKLSIKSIIPDTTYSIVDILAKDKMNRLHVIDWKFGDGMIVSAEDNYQLGFCAGCALYDEEKEIVDFCKEINDELVLTVIQPTMRLDESVSTWVTTVGWVENLIDLAEKAVKEALSDERTVNPGAHCRWCRAKPICPAHKAGAIEALTRKPQSMTTVELAEVMDLATRLKPWISAVFTLAQHEMESGVQVPGYKLVNKRPVRKWVDEAKAEALLKKNPKIKAGEMYKKTLLSPTQIEKSFPDFYHKKLESNVEKRSSGLTIVADSDKRPAVANNMALLSNAMKQIETGKGKSK